ncbi:hypothetical protein [Burkholderia phage BCSR5]|nr:hypothetical protein [Burkholderia phage BCSR5]
MLNDKQLTNLAKVEALTFKLKAALKTAREHAEKGVGLTALLTDAEDVPDDILIAATQTMQCFRAAMVCMFGPDDPSEQEVWQTCIDSLLILEKLLQADPAKYHTQLESVNVYLIAARATMEMFALRDEIMARDDDFLTPLGNHMLHVTRLMGERRAVQDIAIDRDVPASLRLIGGFIHVTLPLLLEKPSSPHVIEANTKRVEDLNQFSAYVDEVASYVERGGAKQQASYRSAEKYHEVLIAVRDITREFAAALQTKLALELMKVAR